MGRPKGWTTAVTGRPAQRVQGHPGLRREHRQAFWAAIARGLRIEDAAAEADISRVAGEPVAQPRWWHGHRHPDPSIQSLLVVRRT